MSIKISEIYVEYQKEPAGLDERCPRFSWRLESDDKDVMQTACEIKIGTEKESDEVWNSGKIKTSCSQGIEYAGTELKACTRYFVSVKVWDNYGNQDEKQTQWDTGLMDETLTAWEGAKWICAPRYTVSTDARGIFEIETCFRIKGGKGRAGIVFGAKDARLLQKDQNEMGLEGPNYIRYEINLTEENAKLDIYRVGYAPGDSLEKPFASTELVNFEGKRKIPIINTKNANEFHTMRIKVTGNQAYTFLDDVLVDAEMAQLFYGCVLKGRMLNPRGYNDVITYPRLNEIGLFAGTYDTAYFQYLLVRNIRKPANTFLYEAPETSGDARKSLFQKYVEVEDNCFVVSGKQFTVNPSNTSIPMFRTSFEATKEIANAYLFIAARGIYECMINGEKITNTYLNPGITQYDKRIEYQTYPVKEWIKKGDNSIGVTLSSGWWSDSQTFVLENYNYFGDKEAFMAKLVIAYKDGSRWERITNEKDWSYFGEGPFTYAGLFQGEHFDARRSVVYREYSKSDYDDSSWEKPAIYETTEIEAFNNMPPGFGRSWPAVNQQQPTFSGQYHAPVRIVDHIVAKSVKKQNASRYIYDLEQNIAGVPRITFHEKTGVKITIRYAEVLYPDMEEYKKNVGEIMVENYRDASSTDIYICAGKDTGEVYQPMFTYHGFRYIEISGVTNPPKVEEVCGLQYSSIEHFDGSFSCSSSLLNRFAENVKWSQLCNFINIPTDCPQRNERMGWAGDTHVFCKTALQNSNLKLFYERNLQALSDGQEEDGRFPEIAPVGGGFGGITYECASIFMVWELYQYYGDIRIIKKHYQSLKKYMSYMEGKGLPGEGEFSAVGPLADWLATQETDPQLMWNAFYYKESSIMEKLATIIGEKEDAETFRKLATKVNVYWNETFVDPITKKTRNNSGEESDTQCSYAIALAYQLVEDRESAAKHLQRKIIEAGYTITTGFFGTGMINKALTDMGYVSDAYRLMLQEHFPSWLYPVTQGATTVWERWDSYTKEKGFGGQNAMNSFNHYSLGAVLSWLYESVLGVQSDSQKPGFSHAIIEPRMEQLEFAKGSVATPYGPIKSEWKRSKSEYTYICELPVNMTADLYLPGKKKDSIGSGTHVYVSNF